MPNLEKGEDGRPKRMSSAVRFEKHAPGEQGMLLEPIQGLSHRRHQLLAARGGGGPPGAAAAPWSAAGVAPPGRSRSRAR